MASTLDIIVTEAIGVFAPNDSPARYFETAINHAKSWRREYIKNNPKEQKTAYLQIGEDYSVDLPEDYGEWDTLGISLPGWNTTRNLIYNSRIPLAHPWQRPTSELPDFLTPPTTYECEQARHGLLDDGYEGYCGFGYPGYSGEFRIDHEDHRIVCNSRVPQNAILVLEYYGFAAADGEDIPVDELAQSWAVAFIVERLCVAKKDWNSVTYWQGEKMKAKAAYKDAIRTLSPEGVLKTKHEAARQRWK